MIGVDREVLGGGAGSAGAAGTAVGVEVEFIDADGTRRREPLSSCWNVPFERVAPVRGLPRSAGSATGRVCGGSLLPASMWGMSPGWSVLLTELTQARVLPAHPAGCYGR